MRAAAFIAAAFLMSLVPGTRAEPQGSAVSVARPVAGQVLMVDTIDREILVGPMLFHVPAAVYDIEEIEEGMSAVVTYSQLGDVLTATELELDAEPR